MLNVQDHDSNIRKSTACLEGLLRWILFSRKQTWKHSLGLFLNQPQDFWNYVGHNAQRHAWHHINTNTSYYCAVCQHGGGGAMTYVCFAATRPGTLKSPVPKCPTVKREATIKTGPCNRRQIPNSAAKEKTQWSLFFWNTGGTLRELCKNFCLQTWNELKL